MKLHEISLNSPFLTNFAHSGGSETLIFLRKNNDLGAGPPKDPLLAKFTEELRNCLILLKIGCNVQQRPGKSYFGCFLWFPGGSHPSGTYEFACYFNGLGRFWASRRAEGCGLLFHVKIKKIHKIVKFLHF